MTKLEIIKLCAAAMDLRMMVVDDTDGETLKQYKVFPYDPITDGHQAMTMLERFKPSIQPCWNIQTGEFMFWIVDLRQHHTTHRDLGFAICECIAQMQQWEQAQEK